jgi:hypothetical protein
MSPPWTDLLKNAKIRKENPKRRDGLRSTRLKN